MSQVLSNTTAPIDDFTYDLNSDGKACGNRPTPSVSVDSNVMYVADSVTDAPLLSNTTPSIDDFGLENLNSDGELCGGPRPILPPTPPPPTCPPPAFPTVTINSTIDGSTESPNRGAGFKNKLLTFNGTAGQIISVWYHTPTFNCYLYLMNPANAVIATATAGSGITPFSEFGNGAILITLPSTGVYTFDCTTFSPGDVGNFSLVVYAGPETTISGLVTDKWQSLFVPETNRIFMFSFDDGGTGTVKIQVYNATTLTSVGTTALNANYSFCNPNNFYNPTDNSVWVLAHKFAGGIGNQFWLRLHPSTGAIIEEFLNPANDFNRSIYLRDRNQVYGNTPNNLFITSNIVVFDCGTRTNVASIAVPAPDTLFGYAYDSAGSQVIVSFDVSAMYTINTLTHAIATFSAGNNMGGDGTSFQMLVHGRILYGIFNGFFTAGIEAINLDTGAVVYQTDQIGDINWLQWNLCQDCLEFSTPTKNEANNDMYNVGRLNPDGSIREAKVSLDNGNTQFHVSVSWLTPLSRTFVLYDNSALTIA